jgi:hypothetical protein
MCVWVLFRFLGWEEREKGRRWAVELSYLQRSGFCVSGVPVVLLCGFRRVIILNVVL